MPGSPSHSSGTPECPVQQGKHATSAQLKLQLLERVQRGTRRGAGWAPPITLYCREWPRALRQVAVCGRLTSRATCLAKRPRLHPWLLFGQRQLRNTSWYARKRVSSARRGGGAEARGNRAPGPAPALPTGLWRGQPAKNRCRNWPAASDKAHTGMRAICACAHVEHRSAVEPAAPGKQHSTRAKHTQGACAVPWRGGAAGQGHAEGEAEIEAKAEVEPETSAGNLHRKCVFWDATWPPCADVA